MSSQAMFETRNHDEALAWLQGVYDPNFRAQRSEGRFHMYFDRSDYGGWTADQIKMDTGGFVAEPCGVVSVCRLYSGSARLTTGSDVLDARCGDVFLGSDARDPASILWNHAEGSMVRIPLETLERVGRASQNWADHRQLKMHSRRPVTSQAAREWTRIVELARRHRDPDSGAQTSVLAAAIDDLLAASFLSTFPNNFVKDSPVVRSQDGPPTTIALAVDFVERNADLPIKLADIASFAAVTPRALQLAFHEHLSTTPMRHLRRNRLRRAHDELSRACPGDGTSVTDVALRWGFTQSSRFIAHYRNEYDESPSTTMRRTPAAGLR